MGPLNACTRICRSIIGERRKHIIGFVGQEELGEIKSPFPQNADRGTNTASQRIFYKVFQLCRPGGPDMNRQGYTHIPKTLDPGNDGFRIEKELRNDSHSRVGMIGNGLLPYQRIIQPGGVSPGYVDVSFWVPRHM